MEKDELTKFALTDFDTKTNPITWPQKIYPGSVLKINARFDSSINGTFSQKLSLKTNDPKSEANKLEDFVFNGKIKGYRHLDSDISHQRIVTKIKGLNEWIVKDIISGLENKTSFQYWHFSNEMIDKLSITSVDKNNKILQPIIEEKWYSSYYGVKEKSMRLSFESNSNMFTTKITYKK